MNQNIKNVIVVFGLVAVTMYSGSVLYRKQSAEETVSTSQGQTSEQQQKVGVTASTQLAAQKALTYKIALQKQSRMSRAS